ncbi:MAG: hypothetical protein KKB50_17225 [Planctomycetes bacterium]|nr:hypothetical protein [Planctomycetota bacterium]
MAVNAINVARVSQNLRAFNLLQTTRQSQVGLFQVQNQLATGLRFVTPSQDPYRAAAVNTLDQRLELLGQVAGNLRDANAVLGVSEEAIQNAVDLMVEARALASEAASDTISTDERKALAVVIDSLIDRAVAVGNERYLDTYLFAGHYVDQAPFEMVEDGVLFRGDGNRLRTIADTDLSQDWFTLSGPELFQSVSERVQGIVDLDPAVTEQTRISDLRGTTGQGVRLGQIVVSDGTAQANIDLSGAATVGDVIDRLNAEMPASLEAVIDSPGLVVRPAGLLGAPLSITISDVSGGQAARDLGLATDGGSIAGATADLDPMLTPRTPLSALGGGGGLTLSGGITLRNGATSATVRFNGSETVEDVLNEINQAEVGVWARIASDGRTLEVVSRVSGADLYIEEEGGQTAALLGIRSLHAGTLLDELRDGRGMNTIAGNDVRITTADGTVVEIDLDELDLDSTTTLQDVVNLFNARGGGAITLALSSRGSGLVITDNTVGGGSLRIDRVNNSPAIDGLGLDVPASGDTLVGRNVNPIRVDGAFTALMELRQGLQEDDQRAITQAGERLEAALEQMQAVQGRMAAQARTMSERTERIESEVTAARILLSEARDTDIAEAMVRFQQLETALQANLTTASRTLRLSVMDALL